jgi:hypothetical protein
VSDPAQPDPANPGPSAALDFHGLSIAIGGDWPEVVEELALDFAWFARNGRAAADVELWIERGPPDYARFDGAVASFVTPRNVVYQRAGQTIVDYFGRAVSVLDRRTSRLVIQGDDHHLVHEAGYQFVLSRVGEQLDACGLPRLHALGLSGAQGAVAVLLPSGGGKSTLALRALGDESVRLLSEDSPLLDRAGRLHPFPLRIGVNAVDAEQLPPGRVRRLERMEFHPKLVLELSAFVDRIERQPQPLRHIVIGRRSLGSGATLERLTRREAVAPLVRESVVGVGLYQGLEFLLQRGLRDAVGKAGVALGRAACCTAALRRADVWRLTLGRDHDANWRALLPLLR